MKIAITTRKVNLLAIDQEQPAKNVFSLPVDNHLREFTISISGEDPFIEIKDRNGENSDKVGSISILNQRVRF